MHLLINLPFLWAPEESTVNSSIETIEESGGKPVVFFLSVFIAPFLETIIYQFSVIKILRLVVKNALWCFCIAVPLSAILFSMDHPYSIYYKMTTFLVGLLYAGIFFIAQYRKDWPAFLVLVILHGSWNFFAFIMEEV
jgi:hypothetical protein